MNIPSAEPPVVLSVYYIVGCIKKAYDDKNFILGSAAFGDIFLAGDIRLAIELEVKMIRSTHYYQLSAIIHSCSDIPVRH